MAKRPTEDQRAPLTGSDERQMRDFNARLKSARLQAGLDTPPEPLPPPLGLASYALRLATELVAGVIVGVAVGLAVDRFFKTAPFGTILCMALGFAAGMLNVIRAVRKLNKQQAAIAPPVAPAADDEDDENS